MNEQLFNGMRGVTKRTAYRDAFIALGFSWSESYYRTVSIPL